MLGGFFENTDFFQELNRRYHGPQVVSKKPQKVEPITGSEDKPVMVNIALKKDPATGETRLSVSRIPESQIKFEQRLAAISSRYKEIASRNDDWVERDLNNLIQDVNEVLIRNSESEIGGSRE